MNGTKIKKTASAYSYPLLIKNILHPPLTYSPHQEIVYRDKLRYDYITLNKRVAQLANALKDLGVQRGDIVGVMDWNSHRYLECFFGIPMMGAVLHTINIRLSPEQIIFTINHAEDDVILVNADFIPVFEGIKDQLETVKKIVLLNDGDTSPATSLVFEGEYEDLLTCRSSDFEFPDFDEDTMATTFYTTGTTGLPKGVYFSHRQLVLHTHGLIAGLCAFKTQACVNSADVYLPLTPMFHVHAWGMPYMFTMLGSKQVYPGRYDPESVLNLITREKVTFFHCVPTFLQMMISSPAIKEYDLSHCTLFTGGMGLTKGLCKAALELGINVVFGYGMSETCPVLTIANLKPHMLEWETDKQVEVRCRTGLPIPNVSLKIIGQDGKTLPHDGKSTGEIVVRAPWLTQGYRKDPQRSEELWADGWLHTGDVGFIDPEGYLQITDRIKDVIKSGGEWISSLELENILSQHEAVMEAAVIGVSDEKWGERPLAVVVLHEKYKGTIEEQALKEFCLKSVKDGIIPKYGVPDRIIISDSIPKTSVGKIDKKELRKKYN